jgi:hypothetical protein
VARALRKRKWRQRGRRGQVAAVATLLGLLLVVTFIANFLTTVVPNQMQVNDLEHEVAVEDQFGRLAALLASAGAEGTAGMQVVQPITLGSDGVAPWAAQDGSSIGAGRTGSNLNLSYGILGALLYLPPKGSSQGGPALPAGCIFTSVSHEGVTCVGGLTNFGYNFSGNSKSFTFSVSGATSGVSLNYSTNSSSITISLSGSTGINVTIYGSHDNVTFSGVGSGSVVVTLIGNYDYVNLGSTGGATVTLSMYGSYDNVYQKAGGGAVVLAVIVGSQDSFTGNATGGASYSAFVTGFNATNPNSTLCPYDNLSSTDHLGGTGTGGSTFNATYNNTAYNGSGTQGSWSTHYHDVSKSLCPFFSHQPVGLNGQSLSGAGLVLGFTNSYAPSGEVAYDEGAVIYAQYGSYPVIIDPPAISLTTVAGVVTAASIWFPYFQGRLGSVAGVGTGTLDLRMLSTTNFHVGANATLYGINPNVPIRIVLHTPYAEAWDAYLNSHLAFAGMWSCAPAPVCTGTYGPGTPIGTITITIPATNLQSLQVGGSAFSPSLN